MVLFFLTSNLFFTVCPSTFPFKISNNQTYDNKNWSQEKGVVVLPASDGKRSILLSYRFLWEILKLECLIDYNISSATARRRGRSFGFFKAFFFNLMNSFGACLS